MDGDPSNSQKAPANPCKLPEGFKGPGYTTGDYWGGHVMPYWVWLLFAIVPFTGFFGIDHLLFRSPSTALTKGLTNIFTLGLWYVYDIVQGLGDRDFVKAYGLSTPFGGPSGLAYGYFSGIKGADTKPKSAVGAMDVFRFVLFCFTVFLPFGVSNYIGGDTSGGLIKTVFCFILIGYLLNVISSVVETFRLISTPEEVYQKGATRFPYQALPFFKIDQFGPGSALMTPDAYAKIIAELSQQAADANRSWFQKLMDKVKLLLGSVKQLPIAGPAVQGAEAAAEGVKTGGEALGAAAIKVGQTAKQLANAASGAVTVATTVAPMAAAALTQGPAVLGQVAQAKVAEAQGQALGQVKQATAPRLPSLNNSDPRTPNQAGGGSTAPSSWDGLVAGGIGLLAFGGLASSLFTNAFRINAYGPARLERNNDDTPPRPGVF